MLKPKKIVPMVVRKVGLTAGAAGSHYLSQEFADKVNEKDPAKGEETLNTVMAVAGAFSDVAGSFVKDETAQAAIVGTLDGMYAMTTGKMLVNAIVDNTEDKSKLKMRRIGGTNRPASVAGRGNKHVAGPGDAEEMPFVRDNAFDADSAGVNGTGSDDGKSKGVA